VAEILFEEFFQSGIVEAARVELRRCFFRRERLRLEMNAAGEQKENCKKHPTSNSRQASRVSFIGRWMLDVGY
jgi:hypothetical protein